VNQMISSGNKTSPIRDSIFKNKLFIFGLLVRFLLMTVSGSEFFEKLFIPFIDYAVTHKDMNPWMSFSPEHFPYGYFPFLILYVPKYIFYQAFGDLALGLSALSFLSLKFPLLVLDTLILWVFSKWSFSNHKRALVFYWLNPILIYITYVYCQLDIISISLLILSLYFILNEKFFIAAFFLGLAISSKFHVIIILPFVMAYFWQNHFRAESIKKIIYFVMVSVGVSLILFLPNYFAGQIQFAAGGSPEVLRLLSFKIKYEENLSLYIGLVLVLMTLGRLVFSRKISESGLVFGSGLMMGVLLLATNPRPGWYFWATPFLSLFFIQYLSSATLLMFASWIFYLIHFIFLNESSSEVLRSLSLTLLQGTLLAQLVVLYQMCVNKESSIRNRIRPFFMGISGDSGAGKNYFTGIIQKLMNDKDVLVVEGDDYHKWERGHENWNEFSHLNPFANQLFELIRHAKKFSEGQSIVHHHYDHKTGKFSLPQIITPKKTVIIQGLHSLYLKSLRDSLDLKIFMNPSEDIRLYWKLQRDVKERGHSVEKVMQSLKKRESDSEKHVRPQVEKSDWAIEYVASKPVDPTNFENSGEILELKYTINSDEPVLELLENLKEAGQVFEIQFLENIDKIKIHFKNQISKENIESVAQKSFHNLRVLTRSSKAPCFCSGYDGLHQLFALSFIQKRSV